ncbi:hypothetical protein B0H10DRAFT_2219621 [Mycena sp. CBHHK59/15]|nr:hypothetical protein B0H10DRAFT_2219621 [Mycena sp. CBHHK59/15]
MPDAQTILDDLLRTYALQLSDEEHAHVLQIFQHPDGLPQLTVVLVGMEAPAPLFVALVNAWSRLNLSTQPTCPIWIISSELSKRQRFADHHSPRASSRRPHAPHPHPTATAAPVASSTPAPLPPHAADAASSPSPSSRSASVGAEEFSTSFPTLRMEVEAFISEDEDEDEASQVEVAVGDADDRAAPILDVAAGFLRLSRAFSTSGVMPTSAEGDDLSDAGSESHIHVPRNNVWGRATTFATTGEFPFEDWYDDEQ